MKNYIVDTNILVSLVREDGLAKMFESKYFEPENRLFTSVVVQGELESLALQWKWGAGKLWRMHDILGRFIVHPIKAKDILTAYARLDTYSQGKLEGQPLQPGLSARNMGKNDLWIAATAHVAGATLITTDNDFDHLNGTFFGVDWVDVSAYL